MWGAVCLVLGITEAVELEQPAAVGFMTLNGYSIALSLIRKMGIIIGPNAQGFCEASER